MLIPQRHSGYTPDGRRLYFKGGGGDAGADARAQEAERQGRITAATNQINNIFNGSVATKKTRQVAGTGSYSPEAVAMQAAQAASRPADVGGFGLDATSYGKDFVMGGSESGDRYVDRGAGPMGMGMQGGTPGYTEEYDEWTTPEGGNPREKLYADQRNVVYDLNSKEVNRQAEEATRANRFGLARSGLAGGSVDVDSVEDINRRTNEGLLRAGGIADQSAADLRASDESTRSNLISMAQSGIDTGSASTMALNGLKVNADSVASQRSGASIGGLFNDMSQAYLMNQQNKGTAAGSAMFGGQSLGVSDPRRGSSGTVGR